MAEFEKSVKRALADVSRVTRLIGTYVSTDGTVAQVDVGGGRIPADFCGYVPEVGESVWVLFVDGTATMLGPSKLRPSTGTVDSAPSGNLVAVDTAIGVISLPYAAGLSLSVGQKVKLGAWSGGGFVYAVVSTTPTPKTPPAAPAASTPSNVTQTFMARNAGSYRGRWWTNEVWASDGNTGAWFYGSSIADTIPNSATITGISIYITARQITGYPPNIGYHGQATVPGGNISPGGVGPVNVFNGWVPLSGSIGNYLRDNAGGIAVDHGGFSIFRSLQADPSSGALRISWRT